MTNDKPPVAPFAMTSGEYVIMPKPKADALEDLIAKADAACDYADAHCRAFPIATAPNDREVLFLDSESKTWKQFLCLDLLCLRDIYPNYTHWAEPLPPPSNPPLPEVFMQLGLALEKIKGA